MKYKMMMLSAITAFLLTGVVYANQSFNVDEKIQSMKEKLGLTDTQITVVKPILTEYKLQMEQLKSEKERRLKEVLTTEQMDKMKEMKKTEPDS